MWPDDGVKSSPNFSKSYPKSIPNQFNAQLHFSTIAKNCCKIFGLLLQGALFTKTFKNRPIWSRWLLAKTSFLSFRQRTRDITLGYLQQRRQQFVQFFTAKILESTFLQCDQIVSVFVQYFAICNNENLSNSITFLPKSVKIFAKFCQKTIKKFAKTT